MIKKLDLKYGDIVQVKNISIDFDGTKAKIVGVSTRNVIDFYILELLNNEIKTLPDGDKFSCFVLPETNLCPIE